MIAAILMMLPLMAHDNMTAFTKWNGVQERAKKELSAPAPWTVQLTAVKLYSDRDKIVAINEFANNALQYTDDAVTYSKADYWASPGESLAIGKGDCEDYAILKFYGLRYTGINPDRMKVTTVLNGDELHTILVVDDYVLDNLTPEIRRMADINYYQTVYAINFKHWWR